ncbi:hypothetical protein CUJ84_pRLN2000197 (plasmid) [Rhizobium leguminosarum]|uniref:Uncharacterized protein n=1 Tax=Rhizobium leguminosarum TaxID=384 RepID=A0A2K9ZER9_RHILE|nr:hypothetical protein CUJ84_pRLN2000197 [Rhizobium leguminosarum]
MAHAADRARFRKEFVECERGILAATVRPPCHVATLPAFRSIDPIQPDPLVMGEASAELWRECLCGRLLS